MKKSDIATAGVALAMIAWWIMPRNNTAKIIAAQGESLNTMIKVVAGVRKRDPEIIPVVKAMTERERTMATAGLHHADRMWLETMMDVATE